MASSIKKYYKSLILSFLSVISFSSFSAEVKDISAEQLIAADKSDWLILDVRTEKEYNAGHVPGAVNISHSEIAENMSKLSEYKDKTVVVYCRSGFRAGKAADVLLSNGFTQVKHLDGDMLNWEKAGHVIEQ